jgi:hypothetical protein
METTEVSETSVNKNLTPGKYPKESTLHSQHGESWFVFIISSLVIKNNRKHILKNSVKVLLKFFLSLVDFVFVFVFVFVVV